MAVTALDATAKGANANAYLTLAEYNQFMEDRLNAGTCSSASNDDKTRAILRATQKHDELVNWSQSGGWPTTATQALLFPMEGLVDLHGNSIDADTLPEWFKSGIAEWACELIRNGEAGATGDELVSVNFGPFAAAKKPGAARKVFVSVPNRVMSVFRRYGAVSRAGSARAVR